MLAALLFAWLSSAASIQDSGPAPAPPRGLMVELLAAPDLALISDRRPEYTWIVSDPRRDAVQVAYRILVASDPSFLARERGDVWDSGQVPSARSVARSHGGEPLAAGRSYAWAVQTWTRTGTGPALRSPFSRPQVFHLAGPGAHAGLPLDRHPLEVVEIAPARLVAKGRGQVFIDFGRTAFGTLRFRAQAPAEGGVVTVHLGEKAGPGASVDRKPGGTIRYRAIRVPLGRGAHTYTVAIPHDRRNSGPAAIAMPERIGEVLPFRYAELVGLPGDLDPQDVRQLAVWYPFDGQAASFRCSDPALNAIWDLCKYSIKATTFCGLYVDGDRERIPYEADAYIDQLGHYGSDREFALARRSLEYLLRHPTWPTEWQLHIPLMAWADYLTSGDLELVARSYADLEAKTLIALARGDGLISTRTGKVTAALLEALHFPASARPGVLRDIVDWPAGERDGFELRPINTVVNALHYRALEIMARLAAALDKGVDARRFADRARLVRRSFNQHLYDPEQHLYIDGEGSHHASLHANVFALAMGLVPPERRAALVEFVAARGMACSVYAAQYLLEALFDAGESARAIALMSDPQGDRSWTHMVRCGATITWEAWDRRYKPNLDWNHAWGAAPANIIPRKLVGVEPLEPGARRLRVHPRPGPLTWFEARVPTIRGPVEVRCDARRRELEVSIPANTTAQVHLPGPAGRVIEVGGGRRRWRW